MTEESPEPVTEEPSTTETDSYIKELRGEAKNYRLKLRDAEKRVEELEGKVSEFSSEKQSEVERLAESNAELKRMLESKDSEIAETLIDSEIRSVAASMGVVDVDAVARLVDRSDIVYDNGVKGVSKALKELLKDKPFLAKELPTPGAGGKPLSDEPQGLQGAMLAALKAKKESR